MPADAATSTSRDQVRPGALSASALAALLGDPEPTPQQRAVVEAPPEGAILVVAGAGSGKTHTMALRVAWLVANGYARPEEILGLTFTRKAASELASRVAGMLRRLARSGRGADTPDGAATEEEDGRAAISTYNAFGASLYREGAIRIGRDPEAVLVDERSAWRLVSRLVRSRRFESFVAKEASPAEVTEAVLAVEQAMSDHGIEPSALVEYADSFVRTVGALDGDGASVARCRKVRDTAVLRVGTLPALVELAEAYRAIKRDRGYLDHADQIALALRIAERAPAFVAQVRRRHRFVLLDEYQDTSVLQARLLSVLFEGTPVMAVGDPHQSIYGWRGASADNLDAFEAAFRGEGEARTLGLSISWRNDERILDAANTLASPLRERSAVPVERLSARPGAGEGAVSAAVLETIDEEAAHVASWLRERLGAAAGAEQPSAAIVFRARRSMERFARALEAEGVPHHVLGLGGLLSRPEVQDVISALRVVWSADAGPDLLRLLAGGRWRIGVRDLEELRALSRWLGQRDWRRRPRDEEAAERQRQELADGDEPGIVDALDALADAPADGFLASRFSAEGARRLREAGRVFARLRGAVGQGLADLVRAVEYELRVDLEAIANERLGADGATGRSRLDAFGDVVSSFLAVEPEGGVREFLPWLERAQVRDDFSPHTGEPEPGAVQLLTAHGAKGLEWDLVVVPRLVDEEFPGKVLSADASGWLRLGGIPSDLRGDARAQPGLPWRAAESVRDFETRMTAYKAELAEHHALEERRLAYVAVTRARRELLLTGSFWSSGRRPRVASPYLVELAEAGLVDLPAVATVLPEKPESERDGLTVHWPADPVAGRRDVVEEAAELVRSAAAGPGDAEPDEPEDEEWSRTLDVLLAERSRLAQAQAVALPQRIAASSFQDYLWDPGSVAAALRRPVPRRQHRRTRVGTRFHEWVERRSGLSADPDPEGLGAAGLGFEGFGPGFDEADAEDTPIAPAGAAEDDARDEERLAALRRTFEASEWGDRLPIAVEQEIHLPFAGRTLVCRIDAVYEVTDVSRPGPAFEVVDWKTGRPPRGAAELARRELQLAVYRIAYARWRGVDTDRVSVAFYYVEEDLVVRPERTYEEGELLSLWRRVEGSWASEEGAVALWSSESGS